ncbi:SAM-dependent methyltransferase [Streptomyces calidiresistens]|uniref:SAM-dependent methyltransferase n=1 Tax=Streptomyces calidiresistens TaxID=1485586 RepID=A0A7W3XYC2_9ACTN|nr:SAM-dependent methyltransferase [Streptomyces calidiresistens]MBB0231681.1 SAM-dependent methyltransferase [Streptomyces calidiresistens]
MSETPRTPGSADAPATADAPPGIDTRVPHSARIWNYWLGGKDNYPVDREAGEAFRALYPEIVEIARYSRVFLGRAMRYLVEDAGIRQFLDIGTGLPAVETTHQLAQRLAPEARVVYVDNDPLVLAHARALLVGTPEGATDYVDADLRDPDRILKAAADTLDLSRPVGVMLMGVMGHIPDDDEALAIVRHLMAALPSGSHLTLYDGTDVGEAAHAAQDDYNEGGAVPYILRSRERLARFFDGLELVEPGLVSLPRWRPEIAEPEERGEMNAAGAVARKP